jgi:hypothetical protein
MASERIGVRRTIEAEPAAIFAVLRDPQGRATLVTSYDDRPDIDAQRQETGIFPVLSQAALRATAGILARTAERG